MKQLVFFALLACFAVNGLAADTSSIYRNYRTAFMINQAKELNLIRESGKAFINLDSSSNANYDSIIIPIALFDLSSSKVPEKRVSLQIKLLNDVFFKSYDLAFAPALRGRFYVESVKTAIPLVNDTLSSSLKYAMQISSTYGKKGFLNLFIYDGDSSEAGFALPTDKFPSSSALFINQSYWYGNNKGNYNKGMSLIHLIANFYGLPPLWGYEPCGDDGIGDTPLHNAPNYGCPDDKSHVTTCSFGKKELVHNYMDNSNDACLNSFTNQQLSFLHSSMRHWSSSIESQDMRPTLSELTLSTFPNPTTNFLNIEVKSYLPDLDAAFDIQVINSVGLVMFRQSFNGDLIRLSIPCLDWASGMYQVVVLGANVVKSSHVMIVK